MYEPPYAKNLAILLNQTYSTALVLWNPVDPDPRIQLKSSTIDLDPCLGPEADQA